MLQKSRRKRRSKELSQFTFNIPTVAPNRIFVRFTQISQLPEIDGTATETVGGKKLEHGEET